jgi:Glycosyltransferase family 87
VTARALIAAAVLAVIIALFASKASAKMPDFEVYWTAAARALAGEALYREEDGHYQFKYLPAFAILAIPAALLPLTIAKALWFVCSVAILCGLIASSLALLPARRKPAWLLAAATAIVMAKFYGHELVLGQVNLLFVFLVVAAVHLAVRGRGALAGLLIAVAIVVKPYGVLFVPWLAAQRAASTVAAASGGLLAALLLPVPIYGFARTVALYYDWWRTVTISTAPNLLNADNVSLAGMYAKWLGLGRQAAGLAIVTALLLVVLAAIMFALRRRVPSPAGLEAGLLLTLIPLLSPQGWDYVFLLSTPAVMCLINYDRELPGALRGLTWLALAVVALSVYDLMGRRAYAVFMSLSIITPCYLAIVAALVALRLRRAA